MQDCVFFFAHLISKKMRKRPKNGKKSWRSRQELSRGNEGIFWSTKIRRVEKCPERHWKEFTQNSFLHYNRFLRMPISDYTHLSRVIAALGPKSNLIPSASRIIPPHHYLFANEYSLKNRPRRLFPCKCHDFVRCFAAGAYQRNWPTRFMLSVLYHPRRIPEKGSTFLREFSWSIQKLNSYCIIFARNRIKWATTRKAEVTGRRWAPKSTQGSREHGKWRDEPVSRTN